MIDEVLSRYIAHATAHEPEYPIVDGKPVRASWAGMCSRAVGFRVAQVPVDLERTVQTAIAFAVGDAIHDVICDALAWAFDGERETAASLGQCGVHVDVSWWADGLRHSTEVKSMQPFAFDSSVRGVKDAPPEGPRWSHLLQAAIGATAIGADVMHLIYADKAAGRVHEWSWSRDDMIPDAFGGEVAWPTAAANEVSRLEDAYLLASQGNAPLPLVPGYGLVDDPPAKGTRGAPWQCRWCDWQPSCVRIGPEGGLLR